ncbi:MAG: hypothetical protein QNI91_10725 [Arenicellales bacterium]|nr:hypothetical protein [Arenicellales bacterium]
MLIWSQFLVCLVVIGLAGVKLSQYGNAIADKTGLGGTWIGLILLATVTSLPELFTGASSVTIAGAPDIAVGDVLGSSVFNLLVIVVLDFIYRAESVYNRANQGHILSAGFCVLLIGFVGFNVLLSSIGLSFAIGHVGISSLIIIILYVVAMAIVFRHERNHYKAFVEVGADRYPSVSLRGLFLRYAVAAVFVVVAAIRLPFTAKDIAQQMGWYESFVGTLLVALVTSVPELVVTIAAVRLGAVDMAIANLFGSNLFNILVLAIDDMLYIGGPLLAHVSSIHAVSAGSAVLMTGVTIVALLYRVKKRVLKTVGWASIFLTTLFLINAYVVYLYGE